METGFVFTTTKNFFYAERNRQYILFNMLYEVRV